MVHYIVILALKFAYSQQKNSPPNLLLFQSNQRNLSFLSALFAAIRIMGSEIFSIEPIELSF